MNANKKMAVIDNDFIEHVASSRVSDAELVTALKTIMSELKLNVVVHPLVYKHEVRKTVTRVKLLFEQDIVFEGDYSFLNSDSVKESYYYFLIAELYKSLTGERLPVNGAKILSYWVSLHSLGEIHSVSMCLICGSGIFLSDDRDSKKLKHIVEKKSLGSVEVYNRAELIDEHIDKGETEIKRSIRKSLAHVRD